MRQEVKRQAEYGRRVRLMFQHEGRFCLLGTPRQCWAPRGSRPIVGARLQRQDLFAFAAVSTHDGVMDSLVLPWANAETMPVFLAEMARRHAVEFIMMVMDQAGWHIAGHLDVPQNMRLEFPPPYSLELNPVEHLSKVPCQDWFANTVFKELEAVHDALAQGLIALETHQQRTQSMTGLIGLLLYP